MKKNRLFHLFASLPPKLRRNYLQSINQQKAPKNTQKLLQLISKQIDRYSPDTYQQLREKTLNSIFPNQHNSQKAQRLITATLNSIEEFIQLQQLKGNTKIKQQLLLDYYLKNGLTDLYESELLNKEKQLNNNEQRDASYYQQRKNIRHNLYFNVDDNKYRKKELVKDLIDIHKDMDINYLQEKMEYGSQIKIIQAFTDNVMEIPLIKEIIQLEKTSDFHDVPLEFYKKLWKQIDERNLVKFDALQKEFFVIKKSFSAERKLHFFELLINIGKLSGADNVLLFNLYQQGVNKGILLYNNRISINHFNNFVDIGVGLKEIEKVRVFIKDYAKHVNLKKENKENIRILYEAFLDFLEENYVKVIEQLDYLEFEDYSYKFRTYTLLIKSLYETKRYPDLDTKCEAFRQYVIRKYKQGFINKDQQEERLNFIKITLQLPYASSSNFAIISQSDLNKELKAMQRVVSRAWLQEKIDEL